MAAFARARGARNVHIAPQAVDNAFWSTPQPLVDKAAFLAVFLGRPGRAKGAAVLLDAWRESGLGASAEFTGISASDAIFGAAAGTGVEAWEGEPVDAAPLADQCCRMKVAEDRIALDRLVRRSAHEGDSSLGV